MTIESDLPALIQRVSTGDEIAVLEALLAQSPAAQSSGSRSTVATRKEATRRAIEAFDLDKLLEFQALMTRIIDVLTSNDLISWDVVLDDAHATALMAEFLDERAATELLTVRRDMIKEAVFDHLDALGLDGQNGTVEVPDLNKKFCREGTGMGTPVVDEQRLQALLGARWVDACDEEIVPERHIPAHIEYRLSLQKVLDMAQQDHHVLEALRTCLVPGKPKTPRFAVRDL